MKPLEDKLMSIEMKVRQLIQVNRELHQELVSARAENVNLKEQLQQKQSELQKIISKNQNKHIAASLSDQEKKQTRQKINALVREIDHCIALLND